MAAIRAGNARGPAVALVVALAVGLPPAGGARAAAAAADTCDWLGERLPLPLAVESAEDIAFKAAAERQYLIFNLMAGGKAAWQRGDSARAIEKWEALLRLPELDAQVQRAVAPLLAEARRRGASRGGGASAAAGASAGTRGAVALPPVAPLRDGGSLAPGGGSAGSPSPARTQPTRVAVSGVVAGGGELGPSGSVVWLRRLDGPTPRPAPQRRVVTQRDKSFSPHVLAVPVGSTIDFQNEDRVYHNVFSIAKPNDFDGGIRAAGSTYSRTFDKPGAVEILCNIHATMKAFVYVVESAYYTTARSTGAFVIRNVPPGRYELSAWHEASSTITRRPILVDAQGATGLSLIVGGDRRPGPFVPDKYGHKRQAHFGY